MGQWNMHPLNQNYKEILRSEFRYIKTAGLAGLVCGANIRPKLSRRSGGSCHEAET